MDIQTIAISFTAFVLAGFWREVHHFRTATQKWQSKIDVTLFGPEGSNGLNGTIKDHETRLRALETKETA